MLAFENFDLCASSGEFAAEAGDKRNDCFAVFLYWGSSVIVAWTIRYAGMVTLLDFALRFSGL